MTEYTQEQLNKMIQAAMKGDYQPISIILNEAYAEYKVPIVVKLLQTIMKLDQSSLTVKKDIALAILEIAKPWKNPAFFTLGNMLGQILQYCYHDAALTQAITASVSDYLKNARVDANGLYELDRTLSGLAKDSTRNLYLEILENIDFKKFSEFCEFLIQRKDEKTIQIILDHVQREVPEALSNFITAKKEERKVIEEQKHRQENQTYINYYDELKMREANILLSRQGISVEEFVSEAEALLEKVYPNYSGIYFCDYKLKYGTHDDFTLIMQRLAEIIQQGSYSIHDLKCKERIYTVALDYKQEELAYHLSKAMGLSSPEAAKTALRSKCNDLLQRILNADHKTFSSHKMNWLRYAAQYNNFEAFKIIVAHSTPDEIYKMIHTPDEKGETLVHCMKYAPREMFEESLTFMLTYLADFSIPNHAGNFPFENDFGLDENKKAILKKLGIPIFPSINDLEEKDDVDAVKKFISHVPPPTLRQFFLLPVMGIRKLVPDADDDWKGTDFSSNSYFIYAINKNYLPIVQTLIEQCLLRSDVFTDDESMKLLKSGIDYAKTAIQYHHSSKEVLDYLQAQLVKRRPVLTGLSANLFQSQVSLKQALQTDQAMQQIYSKKPF